MSEIIPELLDLLVYFPDERRRIRKRREAGEPRPWTDDPVLAQYSFCNEERELDRGTVEARKIFEPYRDDPDYWFLQAAKLRINLPEVLSAIVSSLLPRWDRGRFVAEMEARAKAGLSLEGPAYVISAGAGGSKYLYTANILDELWAKRESLRPRLGDSCQSFFNRLVECKGIGSFGAGQIIAGTKFVTSPMPDAPDWWSFVAAGPGSGKWLNVMLGRKPEPPLSGPAFYATFERVRAAITPRLDELGFRLSAQDIQNCACETFKLWRARTLGQMPKRKFGSKAPTARRRPTTAV